MSNKAPPPCPPPRPDLETDSAMPSPKPSRSAPPPIPLRPDLGEGVDNDLVTTVNIPKIPPPTLKKPKKIQGRPEITVVSAKPMSSPGAFVPFVPESSPTSTLSAAPAASPHAFPITASNETKVDDTPPKPIVPGIPGLPPVASKNTTFEAPSQSGQITVANKNSAFAPPPSMNPPIPVIPAAQPSPGTIPVPTSTIATTPVAPIIAKKPAQAPIPGPSISGTIPASTPSMEPAPIVPIQPIKPSPVQLPGPPSNNNRTTTPMASPGHQPTVAQAPVASVTPSKPAPQNPTNISPKVFKNTKPREPPQRPKSKPVCEPSLVVDPFQTGLQSNTETEKQREPTAPKRKKNKPQNTAAKDFGINNSAFQELDVHKIDDSLMADEGTGVKYDEGSSSSKTSKPFPTVIRTKPNGKESVKRDAGGSYMDDLVQLDSTQVRFSKTQARSKPPPPPSLKTNLDSSKGSTALENEPQQVKSKAKPTIIMSKAKKDESKKNEVVTSPSDSIKSDVESKSDNKVEGKSSKTKRMPSIIRPNRNKKDKNTSDNFLIDSREMPEGQSQEGSQTVSKIVPARKAPPRPSPPKPGPPRPGPPKRSAPTRTQPPGTSVVTHTENSDQGKALPRPATIGKEKGVEKKQKNVPEPTVVSSVVETKIEPSCIALYDYESMNPDDLSFKAGEEIFLVKRINHDWYIGRLGDCEGMMPVKFVEIIEDLPAEPEKTVSQSKVSPAVSSLDAVVLYDFHGQSNDELTLHAGETVHLIELINDDWLKGSCNGISGMFPSNFVDLSQEMKQKLSKQVVKTTTNTEKTVTSGPRCKALYDYHTDSNEDLKFKTNDIIKLTERINDKWLKGEVNGKVGMFPTAYVDIIEDLPLTIDSTIKDSSSKAVAKALHDYVSDTPGDLSFKEGDLITNVNKVSDEWLEGEMSGQKGIFPAAFVEYVEDLQASQSDTVEVKPKGKALYDFTAETDQELSFKAGDEILLLRLINNDWMEGELNNQIGQFPTAFVEVLVPLP